MAIKIGQTNAQSSGGGNSGIDFNSIYLLYGGYEASFGLDGLDVYYFDLEEIGYDLQNLDASMPSKSDFQQGQLIYALDEYGKYLKHIWEVLHLDETDDNKLIVSDYGEIKDTPLVEIIGTQAKGTPNEYTLERMQYFYFMTNEVVKVKFPSDDNEYTFVKSLVDDTTGNLVFNRAEWDSTNSQYIIDTLTIDTNFDVVHSTEVLSSGGGGSGSTLYQHSIRVGNATFTIINTQSTAMSFNDIRDYLYNNGFTSYNHVLMCGGQVAESSTLYNVIGVYSGGTYISLYYKAGVSNVNNKDYSAIDEDIVVELGTASINGGGGSGNTLYKHKITIQRTQAFLCVFEVINSSPTQITSYNDLLDVLPLSDYVGSGEVKLWKDYLRATGYKLDSNNEPNYDNGHIICGICKASIGASYYVEVLFSNYSSASSSNIGNSENLISITDSVSTL